IMFPMAESDSDGDDVSMEERGIPDVWRDEAPSIGGAATTTQATCSQAAPGT
ncbi:hypothetical protein HDU98_005342, partial [Podochytrium sp. JEL0797]